MLYPDDMSCPGCVRDGYIDPLGLWSAPLMNWEDPCSSEEGMGRLESDMSIEELGSRCEDEGTGRLESDMSKEELRSECVEEGSGRLESGMPCEEL